MIINENLYDKEFVEKWTYGFDNWPSACRNTRRTRLPKSPGFPKKISSRRPTCTPRAKPAAIRFGQPLDCNAEAVSTIQALNCLWAITGNLDVPGGNVISRPPYGVTIYPYSTEEVIQLYGQEFVTKLNKKTHRRRPLPSGQEFPLLGSVRPGAGADGDRQALPDQRILVPDQ